MNEEIKLTGFGKAYFKLKQLTWRFRLEPGFIIIGAQKAGTTSLYEYLIRHPRIRPSYLKEIHYFDLFFRKPKSWYLAHYPIDFINRVFKLTSVGSYITGESTPYYLFHPFAPKRVSELYPDMKLICMLRNPVKRAYSHYNHNKKMGREKRDFENAIQEELNQMPKEIDNLFKNPEYYSPVHRHFSYLSRGIYADQLENWHKYFRREALLVINSEDFFNKPNEVMDNIFSFLGIKKYKLQSYPVFNKQSYPAELHRDTYERIDEFFRPHNIRLYEYLGVDFKWN